MSFLNANHVSEFASSLLCPILPKILYEDDTMFSAEFNMNFKDVPEYEAVAVIFDKGKIIDELHLNFLSNLNLTLELKTFDNGKVETFKKLSIPNDSFIDIYNINKPLKEIVICCSKSKNNGKTGIVTVKNLKDKI